MGLMKGLLFPVVAPIRGTLWAIEQVHGQAEQEYYDPARIRQQLEQVDELREAGELDEEEAEAWEDELLARLMEGRERLQ